MELLPASGSRFYWVAADRGGSAHWIELSSLRDTAGRVAEVEFTYQPWKLGQATATRVEDSKTGATWLWLAVPLVIVAAAAAVHAARRK